MPNVDRSCTLMHDLLQKAPPDRAHSCRFSPQNANNTSLSSSAATGGCWRVRSPRPSPPRRTRSAAIFAISPGAAFADASMAAPCRSRRPRAGLKSAPARRPIARRRLDGRWRTSSSRTSSVFIDAGSTNLAAVRAFPDDLRLSVATHDPAIAAALLAKPEVVLWLIGGRVSREVGAALGGRTLADVEALRPELALLGVCALDPAAGLAAFDPEDAEIKRALLRNSGRVAAAVLNEKLETGRPVCSRPGRKPRERGPRSGRARVCRTRVRRPRNLRSPRATC